MSQIPSQAAEPPIITVAELKMELNRWADNATMTFRCPLQGQEFRFYRIVSPAKDIVQLELNQYPETPGVAPIDDLLKRARFADTAANIDGWVGSAE